MARLAGSPFSGMKFADEQDEAQKQQGFQNFLGGITKGFSDVVNARQGEENKLRQRALERFGFDREAAKAGVDINSPEFIQAGDEYQNDGNISKFSQQFLPQVQQQAQATRTRAAEDRALSRREREAKIKSLENKRELGFQDFKTKERFKADIAQDREARKLENKVIQAAKPKKMSATAIRNINEGASIPKILEDVSTVIVNNSSSFGPISGRVSSLNPYSQKSQAINSQLKASSQAFGRYMEGGVLRKEDEIKYEKMFPGLADTPETSRDKLAVVQRLLGQKYQGDLEALRNSGYDVTGLPQNVSIPELPEILMDGKKEASMGVDNGGGLISTANAGQDEKVMARQREIAELNALRTAGN